MKKFLTLILSMALAFGVIDARPVSIVPSKQQKKLTYKVEAFDEIDVNAALTVVYEQSTANEWAVEVQGAENVVPYVMVNIKRGKLTLRMKRSVSIQGDAKIKVKITAPRLREVDLRGATVFNAKVLGAIGEKLEFDVAGASVINIDQMKASKADIEISGASTFNLKGLKAHTVEAEFCGSSVVNVSKIKVTNLSVEASGASVCTLSGEAEYVDYEASGASRLAAGSLKAASGRLKATGASYLEARVASVLERKSTTSSTITLK